MNWTQIEGNWKQLKDKVKQQWGKLTDDQLDVIAGKREHLAGKIQEAYGVSLEEAEQQLAEWQRLQKDRRGMTNTASAFAAQKQAPGINA